MPDWTQDNQAGQLTTALGKDRLLLEQFTAVERISSPFEIVLQGLSVDGEVDFTPHLGAGVSLSARSNALNGRDFHGLLFEARSLGPAEGMVRYELTLRPWFFLLDMGRDSRIFQNKSVKTIIGDIFTALGFSDYEFKMNSAGLTSREYCVQYKESNFAFISRLMEEEGIYYYFKHTESKHTLVLCDAPTCHPPAASAIRVLRGEAAKANNAHLWAFDKRVKPGIIKVTLADSNLYFPGQDLDATTDGASANAAEKAEFYDYPGGYAYHAPDGTETGTAYANTRLQEGRREREIHIGEGNVFSVRPGERVKVDDPNVSDDEKEFLVTAATYAFSGQAYAGYASDEAVEATIKFEGFPADLTWRPLRVTPKPVMSGPQPATVVGKAGEVIDVDKYGRVHVQFDWDRLGQKNEKSSCWLRVSQSSADLNFGHIVLPRIGQEVLVDFMDGDPDRPIITGRVYNATNMPPYTLPDDKTKSTWKSQTIGDSGSYDGAEEPPSGKGFNEIRFEDKGGSEELFMHAQRIFNSWFRLDETRKTGRDTTVRVGRNRTVTIKNNESVTIEDGDETRTLKAGSRTTTIQKDDTLELQSGNLSIKIDAGTAIIEAAQSITLKVGGNKVVVDQQGIHVSGLQIDMKADGPFSAEGLKTDLKADTMMTISGAMVKIN